MKKPSVKIELWDIANKEMATHKELVTMGFHYDEVVKPSKSVIVREWTGYKDSGGSELYDEDIIEYAYKFRGKIEVCVTEIIWKNGWIPKKNHSNLTDHAFLPAMAKHIRKVGNIYQEPELLASEN